MQSPKVRSLAPDLECHGRPAASLNGGRFAGDLHEHAASARVAEDVDSADLSGVSGTPTFFVNGTLPLRRLRHRDAVGGGNAPWEPGGLSRRNPTNARADAACLTAVTWSSFHQAEHA